MSVNKVILLGNLGRDPEIRDTQSGKLATFSLATTDRAYTNSNGVQVPERTEWHNVVAFGKVVPVIEQCVHKGSQVYIEGKLRTRKYTDRNNVERYTTEVVVDTLELLSKPQQAAQPQAPAPNPPFYNQERSQAPGAPAPYGSDNTDSLW